MHVPGMRVIALLLLTLAATGCTATAYWDPKSYWSRPGARLPELADETGACYQAAVEAESPAALAVATNGPRLLPRTEPPPKVWERAPHQVGLERFEERARYGRCMRARGWQPAKVVSPTR
jgi:hypothetical protein